MASKGNCIIVSLLAARCSAACFASDFRSSKVEQSNSRTVEKSNSRTVSPQSNSAQSPEPRVKQSPFEQSPQPQSNMRYNISVRFGAHGKRQAPTLPIFETTSILEVFSRRYNGDRGRRYRRIDPTRKMFARVACRKATGPTRKMSSFLQRINSIGELRKNFYSNPEVGKKFEIPTST